MPNAQGLRWWEEEKAAAAARPAPAVAAPAEQAVLPAVAAEDALAEHHDVGEELEAEAVRRAVSARREAESAARLAGESIVFVTDPERAARLLGRGTAWVQWWIAGVGAVLAFGLAINLIDLAHGSGGAIGSAASSAVMTAGAGALLALCGRPRRIPASPALTVRPDGVDVHLTEQIGVGLIPWRHVGDIRVENRPGQRTDRYGTDLVIELRDWETFARSLSPENERRYRSFVSIAQTHVLLAATGRDAARPVVRIEDFLLPVEPAAVLGRIAAWEAGRTNA